LVSLIEGEEEESVSDGGMMWSRTYAWAWILNNSDHVLYWIFSMSRATLMKFVMLETVSA